MPEGREGAEARVVAWPRGLRWLAAALVAGAGAAVVQLAARLVLDTLDGGTRAGPRAVVLGVLGGVVLPLALLAALRRLFAARLSEEAGQLKVTSRFVALEVPRERVARAHPWLLPLPSPGEWWELGGGGRLPRELERGEGLPGLSPPEEGRAPRAARAFARARRALHRADARALAGKYALFPLLPAAVLFRLHQHITYGSWSGEWQLFGLAAWLRTAALVWSVTLAHLVVVAGALRVAAELGCWAAAWAAPGHALRVRRGAEWACRLAYFGGVPALLALRLLM